MRVISGKARGTKLYSLEGENTRPTLDRVKEALFNIIQVDLQEAIVLDLFAGSGALGIESLSRGATKAFFCDNNKEAIDIIKKNLEKTKLESYSEVIKLDYRDALKKMTNESIDIIFLDPPYREKFATDAVQYIVESHILKKSGIIIIETDDKQRILKELDKIKNINIYDIRKYGRACIIFLSRKE